jgi:hypothetical protein
VVVVAVRRVLGFQRLGGAGLVATVAGNVVIGSLSCFGNQPDPTNHGLTNTATGGKFGQCAGP